jgi:hypothetical protein
MPGCDEEDVVGKTAFRTASRAHGCQRSHVDDVCLHTQRSRFREWWEWGAEVPAYFFLDDRSAQCELCGLGIDVLSEVVTTWAYTVDSEAFSELMVWRERGGRRGVCLYSHAMTRVGFRRIGVLALLPADGTFCPVLSQCPALPSPPSPQIIGIWVSL